MNRQHYRAAMANLRRYARLEAKKAAIEIELEELAGDQFIFEAEAFNAALRDHQAEQTQEVNT